MTKGWESQRREKEKDRMGKEMKGCDGIDQTKMERRKRKYMVGKKGEMGKIFRIRSEEG